MMRSGFTRLLVSSRFSRGVYGVSKAIIFCYLAGLIALKEAVVKYSLTITPDFIFSLELAGQVIAYIILVMCIVRGLPVLWDGRHYLLEKRFPKALRKEV